MWWEYFFALCLHCMGLNDMAGGNERECGVSEADWLWCATALLYALMEAADQTHVMVSM